MKKAEFIDVVAEKSGLSRAEARVLVDSVFDTIVAALSNGDEVRLTGFGTFSVTERGESRGRNPSTGAAMVIPASKRPRFVAGRALKDSVNDDGWGGTRGQGS